MRILTDSFIKSLSITKSALVFVLAVFMLDVIPTSSSLSNLGAPVYIVCAVLKMFVYAGILGSIIEIAANEQIVFTFKIFKENAKKYWIHYFLLSLIPVVIFNALIIPLGFKILSLQLLAAIFNIIILFLFAAIVIKHKYTGPLKLRNKKIRIQYSDVCILVMFVLLRVMIIKLPEFLPNLHQMFFNVASYALIFMEILLYTYITCLIIKSNPEIEKHNTPERELYLISPLGTGVIEALSSIFLRTHPPVFVVLKALSPKHYKPRYFKRIVWRDRYFAPNKLVAITSYTSNCSESYKIAKEFKKRGSKVIMGGPHVTYNADEALKFCDSVVIGEAEGVWKDVIKDYENGALKPKYNGAAIDDFHKEVHRELLDSPPEIIKDFLETTRGCKYRCEFCTIPSLSGGRTRKKPIPEIVELINKIKHKYKTILFIDNNIYSDPAYARELFKALIPLKIKWGTQCTIDIAKNTETLKLAKESGCIAFLFGYEIFGGSLENKQGGKFALADQYIKYTNIIKQAGIKVKAHFIFGFDSDNFRNIATLWKFCFKIKPLYTIVSILTPLPGSKLYHDMLSQNRISNLNWRSYSCRDLVFRHNLMNNFVLRCVYPVMLGGFLLTTSTAGFAVIGFYLIWLFMITAVPGFPLI